MPRLTRFYGLTPDDIDRMTLREVDEYLEQVPEITTAETKAISEVTYGG